MVDTQNDGVTQHTRGTMMIRTGNKGYFQINQYGTPLQRSPLTKKQGNSDDDDDDDDGDDSFALKWPREQQQCCARRSQSHSDTAPSPPPRHRKVMCSGI